MQKRREEKKAAIEAVKKFRKGVFDKVVDVLCVLDLIVNIS